MFAPTSIIVDSQCHQSYPCQHYVLIPGETETKMMSGVQIYNLFLSYGLPIPNHFQEYAPNHHPNPSKVRYLSYPKPGKSMYESHDPMPTF